MRLDRVRNATVITVAAAWMLGRSGSKGGTETTVSLRIRWSTARRGYNQTETMVDVHRLEAGLSAAFEARPVEDCVAHPAERILEDAMRGDGQSLVRNPAVARCSETAHRLAASTLRCLGRLSRPGSAMWRAALVRDTLASGDAELRDAAVQAAESWGDPDLISVLRSHRESEPWLREYVNESDSRVVWRARPVSILLNGRRSSEWRRHFPALGVQPVALPSTSPRPLHWNTPAARAAARAEWCAALRAARVASPSHQVP